MKDIIKVGLLLTLLLNCSIVNSQNQNDRSISNLQLKGKIKSVKTSKWYVEYDYKGNQIKETNYNPFYDIECKYLFDDKGNPIVAEWFNTYGQLEMRSVYKYDLKGNPIEEIKYNSNGEIVEIFTSKYDKERNLVEWCWLNSDRSISMKYTYTFDNLGRKIEEKIYWEYDETYSYQYFYKYNIQGHVIEKKVLPGDVTHKFQYKYDNKGNWIEQISFGHIAAEPSRQIIYFN
tara:strand:- start:86 stop:781 length:696 start_codon:yes stop_codon:yes gene_type:complete